MITLGIELSTPTGSAALLKDGVLLAEKTWTGEAIRHGVLFENLEALMQETRLCCVEISLYAVGRGPGSFSGMRMAFAVAQALALPGKTGVRAVSSGAALALAAARETGAKQIAVVGDARRGQVWCGLFNADAVSSPRSAEEGENAAGAPRLQLLEDWKLVPYEELVVPEGALIVSPEAERLTERFPNIGIPRFPLARHVAELALEQSESEPLEPLYLHPPVFVPPKYLEN